MDIGPVESRLGGTRRYLGGSAQRRQAMGNPAQYRALCRLPLFRAFDFVPVLSDLLGRIRLDGAEYVWMTANHLFDIFLDHVTEGELVRKREQVDDKKQLEKDIARFLTHGGGFAGDDGIHQFVDLFDEIAGHGFRRLLAVPWTAVFAPKRFDEIQQPFEG